MSYVTSLLNKLNFLILNNDPFHIQQRLSNVFISYGFNPVYSMKIYNLWTFYIQHRKKLLWIGIRFLKFSQNFEISWAPPLCVGVSLSKTPNEYIFLCWSFWYIFKVLAGFSLKTIFAPPPPGLYWYQKIWNFLAHILIYVKSMPHPTQTPTQKFKSGFS